MQIYPKEDYKIRNFSAFDELLENYNINGYIIPSSDEFHNEYSPTHLKRLQWFTGFTGSNGICIFTATEKGFFTDDRYLIQARLEIPSTFDIYNIPTGYEQFFSRIPKYRLGFDPNIFTKSEYNFFIHLANKYDIQLISIEENLIDQIWYDKPQTKPSNVIQLANSVTGQSKDEKINLIIPQFKQIADYILITDLSSIAWLLNIRSNDIEYTPFLLAYLIMDSEGNIELFVDMKNLTLRIDGVKISAFEEFKPRYLSIIASKRKIALDQSSSAYWFFSHIQEENLVQLEDPCASLKACKNPVELTGFREAHIKDGVALCNFLYWIENNINNQIDEIKAADKLLEFRKQQAGFQSPSFASISAFGANGAIIHYHPTHKSNISLTKEGLYLIDSGGQYLNGTTDVTRVTCFGDATQEQMRNFTLVLKGMIALSNAKFPQYTTGLQLDALARYELWQYGLDYPHGTGHGVGHFLSVHEGPHSISTRRKSYLPLQLGMITSIEPGFYKEGEYGIRIENLAIVTPSQYAGFLEFETITFAPIEIGLIDISLLNDREIKWLNGYHALTYQTLKPFLEKDTVEWLKRKTLPI